MLCPSGIISSKNSFATLDDTSLARNASIAGIVLGGDTTEVYENISCIRTIENGRLQNFHTNNPDMFLPTNIDVTGEETAGISSPTYGTSESPVQTHSS